MYSWSVPPKDEDQWWWIQMPRDCQVSRDEWAWYCFRTKHLRTQRALKERELARARSVASAALEAIRETPSEKRRREIIEACEMRTAR